MDWGKVDAPLASALAGARPDEPLPVFVFLDRSRVDADVLDQLGLGSDEDGGDVGSASLCAADVAALTDEAWVQRVHLSGRLRLLPRRGAGE